MEVDGAPAAVDHPAGEGRGDEGGDVQGEEADGDLVELELGGEPAVGLALPLLGAVALEDVVIDLGGEVRSVLSDGFNKFIGFSLICMRGRFGGC